MKKNIFSVFFALVLVLSLGLVTAAPAAAVDPSSTFSVTDGTYTTTRVDDENGTIAATLTGTWDLDVIGDFTATGTGGLYVVEEPTWGTTATISVTGTLSEFEITFSGTAVRTEGDSISDDAVTGIEGTITIQPDGNFVAALTGIVFAGTENELSITIDISGSMVRPITNERTAESFFTIQLAIDDAETQDGDTISVAAGTYNEVVTINKSLTLNGAKPGQDARTRDTSSGESILDGTGLTLAVGVGAFNFVEGVSDVIIDGFEVCNYPGSTNPGNGSAVMAYSYNATEGLSDITIQNNYLHDLGWNGILVWSNNEVMQDDFTIQFNLIEEAPYAGIELTNVIDSKVLNNKIIAPTVIVDDPGDAGVGIEIAVRAQPGINITAGTDVLVEGNEISGTFAEGSRAAINILSRAYASDSIATLTGVTVRGNTVSANVIVGILAVAESRDGTATISNLQIVDDNIISNFNKSGIVVKDVLSVQIEGNTISSPDNSEAATNGIQVGPDLTATTGTVNNNQVSGCQWSEYDPLTETYEDDWTASGILVIAPNSALEISGNEVQSCDVGLDIEAGPETLITNNDVHDNSYGFVLWNANPTISFNDIYQNALCGVYRTLAGSLVGTLDAENNWWDSASGPTHASNTYTVPAGTSQGNAVSDDVDYVPWNDTDMTGDSFAPVTTTDPVGSFASIQAGVNASNLNGTVNVAAGTYDEQVEIDWALTLEGAGDTTVIKPSGPGVLTEIRALPWFGGKKNFAGIILVDGVETPGVTLKDFKVDGVNVDSAPLGPPVSNWVVGILYNESGGTIDNVTVVNMQMPTSDRTNGIYLSADIEERPVSVEVKYSTVDNYNRGGIYAYGSALTVDIHDNDVIGPGELAADNVPNGIMLLNGVKGVIGPKNNVSNHVYTPPTWAATGIALWDIDGVTVEGNFVTDCELGIALTGPKSTGGSSNNIIRGNTVDSNPRAGIFLESPNTTYNIITGNTITNNVYGIEVFGPESPTYDPGEEAGPDNVAYFNDITGNTEYGIVNFNPAVSNPGVSFDATYNWWDDMSGPEHAAWNPDGLGDAVSDNVYYEPWLTRDFETVLTEGIGYYGWAMAYLETGWNILSTPFALDDACDTWADFVSFNKLPLYTGGDPEYVNAYYFDGDAQDWGQVLGDDVLKPCDAIHVRMAEPDIAALLASPERSVPTKTLYKGWNLVGLSWMPTGWEYALRADYALKSVELVGSLTGYTQVVSPWMNQPDWTFVAGMVPDGWPEPETTPPPAGYMQLAKGYWVFMENGPDDLAGSWFTPMGLPGL